MIDLTSLPNLHRARTAGVYTVQGVATRDLYALKSFLQQDLDFTLDDLLTLSWSCIFSGDAQWCYDQLASRYGVDPFVLEHCRIYAWQRFRSEDWGRIVEMYNHAYRLHAWAEAFHTLPHVPEFMRHVRFAVVYKYDTNAGRPAYVRHRHTLHQAETENYENIYLDGFQGLAVYYKQRYQGVLSIEYIEPYLLEYPVYPLIVQLQGVRRGSLQWKTNVRSLLLKSVQEVFAGSNLYLQSARHNIYRSISAMRASRFSTGRSTDEQLVAHVVPMARLKANYDGLAKAHGFVYDGVTQDYVDFAVQELHAPVAAAAVA